MKVLIVEDEKKTAGYIRKGLSEHGFVADVAGDGDVALRLARAHRYDLLVLDVMLPGRNGWAVLRELRGRCTIVLVAHRPSSLQGCDEVFELDGGRLVGRKMLAELAPGMQPREIARR